MNFLQRDPANAFWFALGGAALILLALSPFFPG